ncbi:hypothetical protein [Photobacterium piscicola]|uniref:hypothetical protein n=1 Tax=Photobacterium piscicola TaxID=1378299 RepID=UPI003735A4DA
MKIGLKLDEQFVVVKHNINKVLSFDNEFQISLMNGDMFLITRECYPSDIISDSPQMILQLAENEYHRVQRELTEYLGIEIKDLV